ncbi:MAG: pyruvate kinase [bacterium]|nr:pyruvate kinase [bacterium]
MDPKKFKRTKIIATIGPTSDSAKKIQSLLANGVNGVRINFSHGNYTEYKNIIKFARSSAKSLDRSVAVIADLQGPKIRVGELPTGGIEVKSGEMLKFHYGADYNLNGIIPIQHDIAKDVKKGNRLFLKDGEIRTVINSTMDGLITVRAQNGGVVGSNCGINLPDTDFKSPTLTSKDLADISFNVKNNVDYIALSFVQTANDIKRLKKILANKKSKIRVIAKIETDIATRNLEEITQVSDGVMVARGDLAIETSAEDVPVLQKEIIDLCRKYKKPVIIATQMLESMIENLQPTRAEVSDVASAVTDGVDAVMLSGETAVGKYPIETVSLMKRVIKKTEGYLIKAKNQVMISADESTQTAISMAAITLAEQLKAKMIIAESMTGSTALSIASLRPTQPIMIVSPDKKVCNQLSIVWGSKPFLITRTEKASRAVINKLKSRGNVKKGDMLVTAFGRNSGVAGGTDTVRLLEVK